MIKEMVRNEERKRGMTLAVSFWTGTVFFLLASATAIAQLPTATVLGVVRDSSGAIIPGVSLTAHNIETGQTRTARSAEDGSYRFVALPVGGYEIRAENAGFRSAVRSGFRLAVGQEAVVNFTLEVGSIDQTIAVSAEAPLVNTTSSSLGGLVDEQKIADLPLNGRNYIGLTLLQPGIIMARSAPPGSGGGPGVGLQFSSNGAPVRANNYMLDGAMMGNVYGATSSSAIGTTLGIEGMREWRVVTNAFGAEYGLTMGSQMVIVSKSGTNEFHGSLFEYLRNSALDARDPFTFKTALTPRRIPPLIRNNFGGSFGGPIKKDRTFFFGTVEALREKLGQTTISNVIPASAKVDGGLVPRINPVIKPFLQFYPDPNLPNNQFTFAANQIIKQIYAQMRVDQTISDADTAFLRYTYDNAERTNPTSFGLFDTAAQSRNHFATLSENHIFSPTLLNTFRFSLSRVNAPANVSSFELSGPQYSFVAGKPAGNIRIGSIANWQGGSQATRTAQTVYTFSDDLFYTRGRHAVKFGALINRYQRYVMSGTDDIGTIVFANLTTFLLGQPTSYTAGVGAVGDRNIHYTTWGFYVQDDLRAASNLTLNLGLRYEFSTEWKETRGYDPALRNRKTDAEVTLGRLFVNPTLRNFSPRLGFAWDVTGDGRTAIRGGFGLLYNLGNNSITNMIASPPFFFSSTVVNPPPLTTLPLVFPTGVFGRALRGVDYLMQQPRMLHYNLTAERELPGGMAVTLAYVGSRGFHLMQTTEGNPTVPQILPDGRKFWTGNEPRVNPHWDSYNFIHAEGNSWYDSLQFGLVKRLSKGLQFQSSYTWSKAIDENQAETPGDNRSTSALLADPDNRKMDRGLAAFDVPHNWRFNAIYRPPELVSAGRVLGSLLNGWGISGIFALHSGRPFSPNITINRSRSRVLAGFGQVANRLPERPDLVTGRNNSNITKGTTAGCPGVAAGQKLGTRDLWLDPCAFTLQPAGFLGTAGRNILRGPGYANLDVSLTKGFALRFLGESGRLEFRADFFNILNRTHLATPSGGGENADNPGGVIFAGRQDGELPLTTAGRIVATENPARQIQLGLRIGF